MCTFWASIFMVVYKSEMQLRTISRYHVTCKEPETLVYLKKNKNTQFRSENIISVICNV